jgi:hypothetical protein
MKPKDGLWPEKRTIRAIAGAGVRDRTGKNRRRPLRYKVKVKVPFMSWNMANTIIIIL